MHQKLYTSIIIRFQVTSCARTCPIHRDKLSYDVYNIITVVTFTVFHTERSFHCSSNDWLLSTYSMWNNGIAKLLPKCLKSLILHSCSIFVSYRWADVSIMLNIHLYYYILLYSSGWRLLRVSWTIIQSRSRRERDLHSFSAIQNDNLWEKWNNVMHVMYWLYTDGDHSDLKNKFVKLPCMLNFR